MEKFKKSHLFKILVFSLLLLIAPLLPTSMRPLYLYLLLNLLIIALGAESGVLAAFSMPQDDKKPIAVGPTTVDASSDKCSELSDGNDRPAKTVEKPAAAEKKTTTAAAWVSKLKKCPSMPSLFFIGSGEVEELEEGDSEDEEEEEEVGGLSGQELLAKTEMFIGNFYKQLKLQRKESWNKIHGVYQKAS